MVKRFLVLGLMVFLFTQNACAEEIRSFETKIDIQKSGVFRITETITYFFTSQKRGVYRKIPYIITNNEGKKYKLEI